MFFKSKFNLIIGLNVILLILTIAFSSIFFMLPVLLNIIVAYIFKGKRINDLYKYRGWLLGLAIFNIITFRVGSFTLFLLIFIALEENTDRELR